MTDLAPQVAEANRGGLWTIKINEICSPWFKRNVLQKRQKKNYLRETRIALVHKGYIVNSKYLGQNRIRTE